MRTRMKKLALPLSLLALGALGLVACGGGDDDEGTPAEARLPPETRTVAKLSPEQVQELRRRKQVQELYRAATDWASRFATNACNHYMGQPQCDRLNCEGGPEGEVTWIASDLSEHRGYPRDQFEKCKRLLAVFQKSFADATVEEIKFKGVEVLDSSNRPYYLAAVRFSNGELVVFNRAAWTRGCAGPGSGCVWNVEEPERNRRFFQAAEPLE